LWAVVVATTVFVASHVVVFCRRPGLQRIYALGRPAVVWDGRGADGARGVLYVFSRWSLFLALARYPADLFARRLRGAAAAS
jgi:hypothetical protein